MTRRGEHGWGICSTPRRTHPRRAAGPPRLTIPTLSPESPLAMGRVHSTRTHGEPMPSPKPDPRITKRRVTSRRVTLGADGTVYTEEKVDYVRPDVLDAVLADERTRWQQVEVSDTPDAGPAGYDGATYIPAGIDHELAGTFYPATDCGADCTHAPAGSTVVVDGEVVNIVPSEG